MTPLVCALADALSAHLDRPFLLFGHSMGAIVAFELLRELRRRAHPLPQLLIVSGHRAPHLRSRRRPLHCMPTEQLIEDVRKLNGIQQAVLDHQELRDLLLPALRADLAVCETYLYEGGTALDVTICALAGDRDLDATPADLAAWRAHTTCSFALHVIPGDHFFMQRASPMVMRVVNRALDGVLRHAHPWPTH
jgi:medium-chain acyl-[acyl-carrier-protein] hydrolase